MYGKTNLLVGIDPTTEQPQGSLKPVPTLALKFTLSGTTDTGQTLTLADIAKSLIVDYQGRTFSSLSAEVWNHVNRYWMGDVDVPTGSAATAERVTWYLQFFQPEIPQALQIVPETYNFQFNFDTSTLSTRFGSNNVTVDVQQIIADGLDEAYMPYALTDNLDVRVASGISKTYNEANITRLLFKENNSANLTDLEISQDGNTLASNSDLDGYRDEQRWLNSFAEATSDPTFAEWNALDSLRDHSLYSRQTSIDFDADAAGDLDVVRFRLGAPANSDLSRDRISRAGRQSIAI